MARSNLKQTWKILNEVISRRVAKAPYPASFSKSSNPFDIAKITCVITLPTSGQICQVKSRPQIHCLTISCVVLFLSISLQPLTVDESSNIVKSLSANKDPGHNKVILLNQWNRQ